MDVILFFPSLYASGVPASERCVVGWSTTMPAGANAALTSTNFGFIMTEDEETDRFVH